MAFTHSERVRLLHLVLPKKDRANGAAGFTSRYGLISCSTPLRTPPLDDARGPHYRGPWRLPGPDSHRLAALSLSLSYVTTTSLSSWRPSCWTHSEFRVRISRLRASGIAGSSARSAPVCLWRWRCSRRLVVEAAGATMVQRADAIVRWAQPSPLNRHRNIDCRPASYGAVAIGGRASDTPPLVANGPVRSTSVAEPIEMPSASICWATSRPTHSPTG